MKSLPLRGAACLIWAAVLMSCQNPHSSTMTPPITQPSSRAAAVTDPLKQAFVDLRFGMFLHFNMGTFHDAEWVDPGKDPASFNPTQLNTDQWAAAAQSAGMKFAVLTTKHHDGFSLWPTAQTSYNVMNSSVKKDVVRLFVDSFRARGITPAFYFSIWDRNQGIEAGAVSRADVDFIKAQLTELLTNYGDIPVLVIDGWAWQMGHQEVPFGEIRALIRSLQPQCLVVDHNGITEPWGGDLIYFEEPKGIWSPSGNTYASIQGQNVVSTGWFWHPSTPWVEPLSVTDIVTNHLKVLEPQYTTFLLNCPPNDKGLLDTNIVDRLAQVGRAWVPDLARAPLPAQTPALVYPVTPVSSFASSGASGAAVDGISDVSGGIVQTLWQSSGPLPQSVTLDLGSSFSNLDTLTYLPRQDGSTVGTITGFRILVSTNGTTFTAVASGTWAPNSSLKTVSFPASQARYVRLEATAASGGLAIASEVDVGATAKPVVTGLGTAVFSPGGYKLAARHTGMVVDVSGGSTGWGVSVIQWPFVGSTNQLWQITPASAGYYKIENVRSGLALDVAGGSLANDATLVQWGYSGADNQQWAITDLGSGNYRITSKKSGKALDVQWASGSGGAPLVQWTPTAAENQIWRITKVN